jgi:stage II sporulation protein M
MNKIKESYNHTFWLWVLIFAVGIVAGSLCSAKLFMCLKELFSIAEKLPLSGTNGTNDFLMCGTIFLKNLLVVVMCVALGYLTRGMVPFLVCATNGVIIGAVCTLLVTHNAGSVLMVLSAILPHGIIELPAIFLACAIGITKKPLIEKFNLIQMPGILLLVAAVIETWITPLIMIP